MSTTYNVDYNPYTNNNSNKSNKNSNADSSSSLKQVSSQPIPSPIEELRKRTTIDKTETELYDVRKWVNHVVQLYKQGEQAFSSNALEDAYISYMRGYGIMVEIIQKHSKFKEIYNDQEYINLNEKTKKEIYPLLQELAIKLEFFYLSQQQQLMNSFNKLSNVNNTHFNISPVNHIATTTAAYAFRPSHDPRNYPHYSLNDLPLSPQTGNMPSSLYRPSSNSSISVIQHPTQPNVNNLNEKVSKLKIDTSHIPLPSWTDFSFPKITVVESPMLANWITISSNPPSILLIDVRSRDKFSCGCIKHQWIIQIDPTVLNNGNLTTNIQTYLSQTSETEHVLFTERTKFDLIVYYDQNSKNLESASDPLLKLKSVLDISNWRRPSMMLSGGFDAWSQIVGERGIYKFPVVRERKSWFRTSAASVISSGSQSSQQEHNSLYDYFTGKTSSNSQQLSSPFQQAPVAQQALYPFTKPHQYDPNLKVHQYDPNTQSHQYSPISKPQPLPTAPRKESLTTRYHETLSPTIEKSIVFPSQSPPSGQPYPAVPQLQSQQPPQSPQELRPIPPSYPKLHRRRTYIDNPFNGFTTTTSNLYDVPPIAYQTDLSRTATGPSTLQSQQRPSSAEPTVSLSRPSTLAEFHHTSANNIHTGSPTTFSELRSVVSIGTTGLKNLGNTCYMNSIIQCLSGTTPLARYFISGLYKQYINRYNKQGTGGILTDSFADLIREMWSENYNFIAPMTFREGLVRFAPQFAGTDQQDSQEFLLFLLDGLHEDMNQNSPNRSQQKPMTTEEEDQFEKLPDWQASALSWEKHLVLNKSIIVSLFQGQYRSRLTCLSCKHTSTTYNVFMSLSLPIPTKKLRISSVTLYQCLDYFVKEETLDKEDAWKCPKCQKKRKALKQLTLTRLPDILLIHLKRFSSDGLFRNKLDATVKCPSRNLDLSSYIPASVSPPTGQDRPSFVYELYAVSNHYGSLSGGHYTACVRDKFKDKWHYFDDSKFSLCDENKVVTKAAYNLFYVRSNVK